MNLRNNYTLVPVDLCIHVTKKRLYRQFQLYLLFKFLYSGKVRLTKDLHEMMMKDLHIKSDKTLTARLHDLIDTNWLGFNPRSMYVFVRGFDHLINQYGFDPRSSVEFCIDEILQLKAFCIAVSIGDWLNLKKYLKWKTERKKARSKQSSSLGFFPMSTAYLAAYLGISISTAHEYKSIARDAGYIQIKNMITKTGIPDANWRSYLKANPEDSYRMRLINGEIALQESDCIRHNLNFKSRKKPNNNKSIHRKKINRNEKVSDDKDNSLSIDWVERSNSDYMKDRSTVYKEIPRINHVLKRDVQ